MCEHVRSLINMNEHLSSFFNMNKIEFFEIPEECQIELQIGKHTKTYSCICDLSHGNIVKEVYDDSGEIIATSMSDLMDIGVSKATVIQLHEVELRH